MMPVADAELTQKEPWSRPTPVQAARKAMRQAPALRIGFPSSFLPCVVPGTAYERWRLQIEINMYTCTKPGCTGRPLGVHVRMTQAQSEFEGSV